MTQKIMLASLIPVGFQSTTLRSTATSLNSTVRTADVLHISIETQNARYACSTTPTATTGVLLITGNSPYWIDSTNRSSTLQFSAAASGSVLQVQGFNRKS